MPALKSGTPFENLPKLTTAPHAPICREAVVTRHDTALNDSTEPLMRSPAFRHCGPSGFATARLVLTCSTIAGQRKTGML